jgi:hypothetical protein
MQEALTCVRAGIRNVFLDLVPDTAHVCMTD